MIFVISCVANTGYLYIKKATMRILIVYGTTEGQTHKVAEFMAAEIKQAGHEAKVSDLHDATSAPANCDAVLIGGSVHISKYQSSVSSYIKKYLELINELPGAFFSVSLGAASENEAERIQTQKTIDDLMAQTGWKPLMTTQIAGALKFTQYNFFKRFLMNLISNRKGGKIDTSKDYEYTDWNAVKKFVNDFLNQIGGAKKL
jgi:menaquinone-dependent protoporphyrinogen oxidase